MTARRTWLRSTLLLAGSLFALQVAADAPSGQYSASDGTVRDNRTGLTWQQRSDATDRTWQDAKNYCAALALAGGGWRLPAYKELLTLVDPTRTKPAIDLGAFPLAPSETFWSGSTYVTDESAGSVWFVDFADGSSNYRGSGGKISARCVR